MVGVWDLGERVGISGASGSGFFLPSFQFSSLSFARIFVRSVLIFLNVAAATIIGTDSWYARP
jgi:hypothetical protein